MAPPSPVDRVRSWLTRLRRPAAGPDTPTTQSIHAAADPLPIAGRYRLESAIGQGGTGIVYRARDLTGDRLVAVKLVRAELLSDPQARQRFRTDAEILSQLRHPSIVEIHDFGTFPEGGGFLVMELVQGEDLRRLLQREGRLDHEPAMRILSAVCDAVEAAHHAGVLHRDLKPENILLPANGAEVKVLDFGVARTAEGPGRDQEPAALTPVATGGPVILGTPAYMAPELFQGAAFSPRSDVFSLGVLAFEILSGDLPFGRGPVGDIVLAHTRGASPMPAAAVSAAAERAIRTAIDPNPDRRPASPQAFAHLLTASLNFF